MLSYRCLSVLSCPVCPVCDVGVLWPNGWTDENETWHAGRPRPRRLCVRSGSNPLPQKAESPPAQFSAHVYCGQTAAWIKMPLGTEVGLGLRDIVFDVDPIMQLPTEKRHTHSQPIFDPCLLWPRSLISATAELLFVNIIVIHSEPKKWQFIFDYNFG